MFTLNQKHQEIKAKLIFGTNKSLTMYIRKVDEAENKLNKIQAYIEQSNYDTRKDFY